MTLETVSRMSDESLGPLPVDQPAPSRNISAISAVSYTMAKGMVP